MQGPDGSPTINTIESVEMVITSLQRLKDIVAVENPGYKIDVTSLMTLVCERLFSIMRSQFEMPTTLQFCKHFGRSVMETMKSITEVGFHYYTSEEKEFYPVPPDYIRFNDLPKVPKPLVSEVSDTGKGKLKAWAKTNGTSVRQQSVQSMSTKDRPGTLPIEIYDSPKDICLPLELLDISIQKEDIDATPVEDTTPAEDATPEEDVENSDVIDATKVLYENGTILVVKKVSSEYGFLIGKQPQQLFRK